MEKKEIKLVIYGNLLVNNILDCQSEGDLVSLCKIPNEHYSIDNAVKIYGDVHVDKFIYDGIIAVTGCVTVLEGGKHAG